MIKKILRINDFRLFQRWSSGTNTPEFERVNLIYGVNGSGKSTLASLLDNAPTDTGWRSGLRVTVLDSEGRLSTVSSPDAEVWKTIRVFNKDFVRNNLRFDIGGDSTTKPLLILGQAQIDKQERIAKAETRLAAVADELSTARTAERRSQRAADTAATQVASLITQELGMLGGRFAPRSYDARQVKRILAGPSVPIAEHTVAADLEFVRGRTPDEIETLARTTFDTSELETEVSSLLARKATSEPIEALRHDLRRAAWVEAGLDLHQPGGDCAFCGSLVTQDRVARLERHFDESVRLLQRDINRVVERIESASTALTTAFGFLPQPPQLSPEFRDGWTEKVATARTTADEVIDRLGELKAKVEEKRANLFSETAVGRLSGANVLDLTELQSVLEAHNAVCRNAEALRRNAAERVERARIEAIRGDYESNLETAENAKSSVKNLQEEQRVLARELRELAQQNLDASPLAESLNNDLVRLLGRDDLKFSLADEGYSIRRGGEPALYLSEGEKTAISLLYFLKSLDAHDCDRAGTIVVIDDPVSSLDSNIVAGVSAHLWARLVGGEKCRQLFLLTHSFELFRSWTSLLDRLPQTVAQAQNVSYTTQELRVRVVRSADQSISREPFLMPWPSGRPLRNRIRSEYHYLFWRAAETLQKCREDPTPEAELDAAAVLPNVCRRMLEAFLSFKYPEKIGDLRALLEAAIGGMDESVTRTRLVTYLHHHSHNEEGDISRPVARPESINILGAVFDLIKLKDAEHYEKMCSALQVDPALSLV